MVNMLKVLVAVAVLLIIIGLGLLGKNLKRAWLFRSAKTNSSESLVLEAVSAGIVTFFAVTHYTRNDPAVNPLMWIGLFVFFAGGIVQLIARKHLYDDYSFEKRLHSGFEAAQTGIYSKLRHPSQTALLLFLLGLCLVTDSLWGLGVFVVLFIPSVLYRISQEEQKLLDQFGERYEAYRSDSKRIIPGIY
ncbi:isoprenylcysteine carboxylmethyltransferase family protein [Candidatus Woesearchaeota archaeon]|nr:MAG: isoprenylcysteine carboxylmethyltransferase family protein [Candidatus Woesearchaeota archaeon]